MSVCFVFASVCFVLVSLCFVFVSVCFVFVNCIICSTKYGSGPHFSLSSWFENQSTLVSFCSNPGTSPRFVPIPEPVYNFLLLSWFQNQYKLLSFWFDLGTILLFYFIVRFWNHSLSLLNPDSFPTSLLLYWFQIHRIVFFSHILHVHMLLPVAWLHASHYTYECVWFSIYWYMYVHTCWVDACSYSKFLLIHHRFICQTFNAPQFPSTNVRNVQVPMNIQLIRQTH